MTFKLDLIALVLEGVRPDVDVNEHGVHVGCAATLAEVSRQLRADPRAAGLSEDLGEAIESLLADRAAMQQAGEEMPWPQRIVHDCFSVDESWHDRAARVITYFRPLVARLTQQTVAAETRYASAFERAAQAEREIARLTQERDEARVDRDMFKRRTQRQGEELSQQDDAMLALRQRAERAEQERDAMRSDTAAALSEADAESGREVARLRTRIAELEASREPGADVVESLVLVMSKAGAPYESHALHDMARAVLAHLATMGEEAVPFEDELMNTLGHGWSTDGARGAVRALRGALSPVLGALRAKVAELEAENAKATSLATDRLLAAADALERAQTAEKRVAEAGEEEREACRDIARSIYQGNTEIPVKDTAAWYACAEFIDNEIGARS